MKTLTLVRHAKSSWKDPDLADFDRPLNKRGRRDLPVMAQRLAAAGEPPDRIITSPAVRAHETARELAQALGFGTGSLISEPRVYEASQAHLLEILRHQPDACVHLMLVGHVPAVAGLGHALCGVPEGKFPTCGILRMRLPVEHWAEVVEDRGEPLFFDFPKRADG